MNGPYKMNVLLIPAFILMPSPAHAAQVHKQHIPSIRRNRTNTGRHPAHAATRYRQARLLPSPPTAPPPSSMAPPPRRNPPHQNPTRRKVRARTAQRAPSPPSAALRNPHSLLSLSSTPCRRARSRGSPRASARRTSSRASPSGSS
jgi:hypothetical protein